MRVDNKCLVRLAPLCIMPITIVGPGVSLKVVFLHGVFLTIGRSLKASV